MELKHFAPKDWRKYPTSFNRTTMELKRKGFAGSNDTNRSFNRTTMELKQNIYAVKSAIVVGF